MLGSGKEDTAERVAGQKLQLVFSDFGPDLSPEDMRATIQEIFDYMFDGAINESFLRDLRKQAPAQGWVVTSGIVVSEKAIKPADQLSDREKELEALKRRHFRYSTPPNPNWVFEATGYTE